MSLSTISSAAASTAVINAMALYKQANGEYLASDVASDYAEANKLGLVKLQDGNYGTLQTAFIVTGTPAVSSSRSIQSALNNLVLGG